MLRVYHKLVKEKWHGLELLHQNHDSILIQYNEGDRDVVLPEVMGLLESDLAIGSHTIQIPVEASYGQNWGELTTYAPAA